jgi:TRAP-type C4-dicarboxylate transport system permease small subunit
VRGSAFGSRMERVLGWALVGLMSLMVVDVTWQVASRFVFRAPSSFTEELAGFLLIWIGLLGAAYGVRTRAHLGIDILVDQLGGARRRGVEVLAHALVLLFALSTMVGGGIWLVLLAFRLDQISAAAGIRMGFVYLALPLSGALMVLFSLEFIVRKVKGEES